jgi:DNA-binding transcriptional MerR regulator
MRIGGVAAAAGVSVDTIRYYERIGLLPRPLRTTAGYRMYPPGVVHRLGIIRSAQAFGFPLGELSEYLRTRDRGGKPCYDVRQGARRLLDAADRQIVELNAARRRMRKIIQAWDDLLERTPPDKPAYLLETLAKNRTRA